MRDTHTMAELRMHLKANEGVDAAIELFDRDEISTTTLLSLILKALGKSTKRDF